MKFANLDDIWKKFPNKYQALVMISKEVRKINDAKKPVMYEPVEVTPETAVPEPEPIVAQASEPKKRGRKPKKAISEEAKTEPKKEEISIVVDNTEIGKRAIAEKNEDNAYIQAIKKILKL
jgi:hypothetical protein